MNCREVLARAKHRTKKEIGRLVRELDPLPDVPPRIEPLGPALTEDVTEGPMAATWQNFVANPVRELPGERPREWMGLELAALATASA